MPSTSNAPMLLIDGDILVYRAIASVEKEIEFEEDIWVMSTDLAEARSAFKTQLDNILDSVEHGSYKLCLTDTENFRKTVYPEYKSNRKKTRKPMGFRPFRKWVMDTQPIIIKPTLEADDVMGIIATKPWVDAIIVSADKDLMQIPGKHLVDGKVIQVTEEEGTKLFFLQTLMGDAVDGYPGCPGIGKVKAEKLLAEALSKDHELEVWAAIVDTYAKAGLTEEDALVQARCARILRWDDWDQEKQKVNLWEPITA